MTFSWRRTAVLLVLLIVIAVAVGVVVTHHSTSHKLLAGLGDSFASGEGNEPFTPASVDSTGNGCHDSISGAYPVIAAQKLGIPSINNACSGATTNSMLNGTAKIPSQLNGIHDAKYVTVTIGGNDIDALGAIFNPPTVTQYAGELAGLQPKLVDSYKRIKSAAPHAHVLVVGYPGIVPQTELPNCVLNTNDLSPLRTALAALDSTIEQAANSAGVQYVDASNAFAGHELCTPQPWINGIDLGNLSASFHPNVDGQTALATLVVASTLHSRN